MRILIAGIIGGIVMFIWNSVAHMALPLGEMGFETAADQDTAIAAVQATATSGEGIYMLPGMSPEQWRDEAARTAFVDKYKSSPYAFVVHVPSGNPATSTMVPNLIKQFVTDTLAAIVAAWVLALGAFGFGKRVAIAGAFALFGWLIISVPYWNWYLFPASFTARTLITQLVCWLMVGQVMSWGLG